MLSLFKDKAGRSHDPGVHVQRDMKTAMVAFSPPGRRDLQDSATRFLRSGAYPDGARSLPAVFDSAFVDAMARNKKVGFKDGGDGFVALFDLEDAPVAIAKLKQCAVTI